MRYAIAAALLLFAALDAGEAGARRDAATHTTLYLVAEFVPERFATRYTAILHTGGRVQPKRVDFRWTFVPPDNDPRCDLFTTKRPDKRASYQDIVRSAATWLHGDHHSCDHRKQGPRGHRGVVSVIAVWLGHSAGGRAGSWTCRARIRGSNTHDTVGECAHARRR